MRKRRLSPKIVAVFKNMGVLIDRLRGQAEQQLKIELPIRGMGCVDIAGFRRLFTKAEEDKCVLLIETLTTPCSGGAAEFLDHTGGP
jgi:hypothetical protein